MPFVSEIFKNKTAVALGNFDGLHRGHMAVINSVADKGNDGMIPIVLKFREHPGKYLGRKTEFLCENEVTEEKLNSKKIKTVYYSFPEVCDMYPQEFVRKILVEELNAGFVSCGYNYKFGKSASGDSAELVRLCRREGIEVCVHDAVMFNGIPISSSNIRNALKNGDMKTANGMLGYEFSYDFTVVTGDKRGRILGAPTINQFFPDGMIVPRFGVYASRVNVDGKVYPAVTNIGLRPTIGNSKPRSETFIEGFSGNLYGKRPTVSVVEFLRPEIKFDSLEDLSRQIAIDAQRASEIIGV